MKKIILILVLFLISFISIQSQVKVRGYFRKDGTYVQPHYRTYPDGNVFNNWSTKGNINPYTGKKGTIDPYRISTPKTRVYSNYVHYPYIQSDRIDKTELIKQEIKTSDSKNYLIIRKKYPTRRKSIPNKNRIIKYE